MTRRSFKNEIDTLRFILLSNAIISANPIGQGVISDFENCLSCKNLKRLQKYLMWGLLIGRSLDSFTVFFLDAKGERPIRFLDPRIDRICNSTNPLTSDLTIKADLMRVKNNRNDLFHTAGRHFSNPEMQDFVFTTTRCIQQLTADL